MNEKIIFVVFLVLIVLFAGCVQAPADGEGATAEGETNDSGDVSAAEALATAQNVTETEAVETEEVDETEPVVEEKTNTQKVVEYLDEHTVDTFKTLAGRILDVTIDEGEAKLTYRVSSLDPNQESTYLSGVLFLVFPSIDDVDVNGYNAANKVIEASHKFPTRDGYNFAAYSVWFPDYTYTECTSDEDCDDNDYCTGDICDNGRCSNPTIVKAGCL